MTPYDWWLKLEQLERYMENHLLAHECDLRGIECKYSKKLITKINFVQKQLLREGWDE
jgi:hypothetical protein